MALNLIDPSPNLSKKVRSRLITTLDKRDAYIDRDREISKHDFVFYSYRLIRLVVEHGLGHLPFTEKQVVTPTGHVEKTYALFMLLHFFSFYAKEIVLKVYMHCEGCARKVKRCLKGFQGVEDVETDCKAHKVIVKGKQADPLKVLERVRKKSHRQVELLSPIPKPPMDKAVELRNELASRNPRKWSTRRVVVETHVFLFNGKAAMRAYR
ncbi:hypothetical protein Sjap_015051 [Stephania japonica]|uniref:HMA domain-containing protein n=1 Tax=Stephania japonica TaxID=461633 RepID=A0AAP0IIE6_9MAGN